MAVLLLNFPADIFQSSKFPLYVWKNNFIGNQVQLRSLFNYYTCSYFQCFLFRKHHNANSAFRSRINKKRKRNFHCKVFHLCFLSQKYGTNIRCKCPYKRWGSFRSSILTHGLSRMINLLRAPLLSYEELSVMLVHHDHGMSFADIGKHIGRHPKTCSHYFFNPNPRIIQPLKAQYQNISELDKRHLVQQALRSKKQANYIWYDLNFNVTVLRVEQIFTSIISKVFKIKADAILETVA